MSKLKIFLLLALILLTDFYFFHPSIRVVTFAMTLLVGTYLLRRGLPQFRFSGGNLLWQLLILGFSFSLYMSIIDLIRGMSVFDVSVKFFSHSMIILLTPAFIEGKKPYHFVNWFVFFALVSLIFAIIQVAGVHVSLADVVPDFFGILVSDLPRKELIDHYGRVTGATSNTIAFALQMVILILLAYSSYLLRQRLKNIQHGALAIMGLLLSQTRAALFGIIPSIVLGQFVFAQIRMRVLLQIISVLVLGLGLTWLIYQSAADYFPYITKKIDVGDTHRLWTNWYMTVGVLHESPWFGISPKEAWNVCFKYADMDRVLFRSDMLTPTHHNQLAFYFRYYGVIGLIFLLAMYFKIYEIIKLSPSMPMRVFLGSLFVFDLMYSMTHNNKLLTSPILWIFLSLAFLPIYRANRVLNEMLPRIRP